MSELNENREDNTVQNDGQDLRYDFVEADDVESKRSFLSLIYDILPIKRWYEIIPFFVLVFPHAYADFAKYTIRSSSGCPAIGVAVLIFPYIIISVIISLIGVYLAMYYKKLLYFLLAIITVFALFLVFYFPLNIILFLIMYSIFRAGYFKPSYDKNKDCLFFINKIGIGIILIIIYGFVWAINLPIWWFIVVPITYGYCFILSVEWLRKPSKPKTTEMVIFLIIFMLVAVSLFWIPIGSFLNSYMN